MFRHLSDFIDEEMRELDKKAASEGKLSMQEIEFADTLAHLKKNMLKAEQMQSPVTDYYDGHDRYSKGRGYRMYDDDRYSGYERGSRVYRDNDMMDELHELMEKAPNEKMRNKYRDFIEEMKCMI